MAGSSFQIFDSGITTYSAKAPSVVDADDFHVLADVRFASAAQQALAASNVHFSGDEIAFLHAGHFIAEGDNLAAEFMSGDERRMNASLRPAIPFINVEIGAANGSGFDLTRTSVRP